MEINLFFPRLKLSIVVFIFYIVGMCITKVFLTMQIFHVQFYQHFIAQLKSLLLIM